MILWLDKHVEGVAKEIIEWTDVWPARLVGLKMGGYKDLGNLPPREVRLTKIWEDPVTNVGATKYVVGFVDMVVRVEITELLVDERPIPKWLGLWPNKPQRTIGFEAKTGIPSIGELIRQLRLYQQYCRHELYVVSPDDRFAEQLLAQGFGFIKYPDRTIQNASCYSQMSGAKFCPCSKLNKRSQLFTRVHNETLSVVCCKKDFRSAP